METNRERIYNLLEDGRISASEAEMLIRALGTQQAGEAAVDDPIRDDVATDAYAPTTWPVAQRAPRETPRSLQIRVHQPAGKMNINVTIPLSLVRFAARLLPNEAKRELAVAGVDLEEVLTQVLSGDIESGEVFTAVAEENGVATHIEMRAV